MSAQKEIRISPENMSKLGTVDPRFQAYNVEMAEVIGGNFWKPYDKQSDSLDKTQQDSTPSAATPVGMDPHLYQYRPPKDLSNVRLRKLAGALGPAYVRVSGTWANTVFFQDKEGSEQATPPKGFSGVLTRPQWQGVIDFSQAVDAELVTSFATSAGTRDASGVWTPKQASQLIDYTKSIGGKITAAEFMNEPTYAAMGGAPDGYDATAYGRDIAVFHAFIKKVLPDMVFLGPGSVGEGGPVPLAPGTSSMLKSEDLLRATGDVFDAFSYHFYGAVSERMAKMGEAAQTTANAALSKEWLTRTDTVNAFYANLRDRFVPGKPLWITETAESAAGGNPWAATFVDSFRYLYQLGSLAQRSVQVIMHNTLAASDYSLLDENTYIPKPNYWAALLWRKLMGTTVLDPGLPPTPNVYVFAHSLREHSGGVVLLVINTDRTLSQELELTAHSDRYTLTATDIFSTTVDLNGRQLQLGANDELPTITGIPTPPGKMVIAPTSITFLTIPDAKNRNC